MLLVASYVFLAWALYIQTRRRWMAGIFTVAYAILCLGVLDYVILTDASKYDFIVGRTYFSAMPMDGLEPRATETRLVFLFLVSVALVCGISTRRTMAYPQKGNSSDLVRWRGTLKRATTNLVYRYSPHLLTLLSVVMLLNVWHMTRIDWALLWVNDEYLAIKQDLANRDLFLEIYHRAFRVVGLITIIVYYGLSWAKHPVHKIFCLFIILYPLIILLAGSSRWTVAYGFVALIAAYGFRKLTVAGAVVLFVLTLFAFEYAIYSRSANQFGLSQIAPNIAAMSDSEFISGSLSGIVVNSFEGALNFANALEISPDFPSRYQLLSLSPLPSSLDGYDVDDAVRITIHVPMGALGEAYHFEWYYQIIYVASLFWFFRMCFVAERLGSPLIKYGVGLASIYLIYLLPTYTLKTTWKGILLIPAVVVLLKLTGLLAQKKRRKRSSPVVADQLVEGSRTPALLPGSRLHP